MFELKEDKMFQCLMKNRDKNRGEEGIAGNSGDI
jgi:hypothetical protein